MPERKIKKLLVKKKLSLDNSFKGDFNLNNNLISKDEHNQFIFTGLQIIKNDHLLSFNKDIFSMNERNISIAIEELIQNLNLLKDQIANDPEILRNLLTELKDFKESNY